VSEVRTDYYWFCQLLEERICDGKPATDLHRVFLRELHNRLAIGEVEYGDKSCAKKFVDILVEVCQEDLDRAGWSYILWRKATKMLAEQDHGPLREFLDHMVSESLSCAHRAFGAWERDNGQMTIAAAALDMQWPDS
jgi:hypothetical protein